MVNNMTFIDLTNKNSFVIPLIYTRCHKDNGSTNGQSHVCLN